MIWSCLFSMLFVLPSPARLNCSFTHYSSENGLSQNTVMNILEDSKGYMWFATWDGINKFDGYTFKTYNPNDDNPAHFTNNRVDYFYEDTGGYLWILSYDNRAHRFDPRTETFIKVPATGDESHYFIHSIQVLPDAVWLLTANEGAIRVSNGKGEEVITGLFSPRNGRLLSADVLSVACDTGGNEWLLTGQGLYKYDPVSGNLLSFFTGQGEGEGQPFHSFLQEGENLWFGSSQGKVWRYNNREEFFELKEFAVSSPIVSMQQLNEQELIVATGGDGFFVYNTHTGTPRYYNKNNSSLPGNHILSMFVDSHSEVWFDISEVSGVTHYNPESGNIIREIVDTEKGNAERSDPRFHIHEDINGFLWVHPFGGGFSRYNREKGRLEPFYNRTGSADWRFSNKLHSAYSDRAGNLWMSTHSKGLEKISFSASTFTLTAAENLPYESLTNDTRCLYEDYQGRIWVGTKDGKIRVYTATGEYIGYLTREGTISRSGVQAAGVAYHIMQDQDHVFWISTKGEGLVRATEQNGRFSLDYFKYDPADEYSLSDNNVYYTHADTYGRIWVATFGGGLNYLEYPPAGTPRFINYRNRLTTWPIEYCYRVRTVTSDTQGRIWVGTTSGAVSFQAGFTDPSTIRFHHYYRDKDTPGSLSNNDVHSILVTREGEVYLATFGGGLNRVTDGLDPEKIRFTTYTVQDGLPGNVLLSMQEDTGNKIWISSENGLCRFNPGTSVAEAYDDTHFNFHATFNEAASLCLRNGEMLFGAMTGVVSFRPGAIRKSTFIPPVVFTGFLLGNEEITPGTGSLLQVIPDETHHIWLKPDRKIFTLQYAALDMKAPEKIQYAYKLEGFDQEWNYVDKLRSVTYINLPKGDYRFLVRSTNAEGVWVDNIREMQVTILPTFRETPWGILLFVVLIFLTIFVAVAILFTIYRLKHKVRMEQQISDIKLRFFTNISHELRTPLTLIAGPVEHVLSNEQLTPGSREQLQIVERNTNRMLRLINQILDFRKIQNKKMKLKVQPVDIVQFVRRVMDNFESLAEEHRIDFILESEIKELTLWLDIDKLEKIVFNLVSNAFKYTPRDKMIRVFIREDEESVSLAIEDQGIGIAESRRESIFERFENLVDKNIFDQSSTGIGLSLVKELVEIHKANISVNSRLGEGSIFTVTFRKGKEHYDATTEFILSDRFNETAVTLKPESEFIPTTALGDVTEETPENIGKDVLLIVEDNAELRTFLRAIFHTTFRVVEAAGGTEGLNKARQLIPDMIISDVMMPGLTGIELIKELREQISTSHIPVILLTAKASIESKLKGLEYGADDYITKPFSSTYLQARVGNLLAQRRKLQDIYRSGVVDVPAVTGQPVEEQQPQPGISPNDRRFMDKLYSLMESHMDNGDLIVDDLVKELAVSRSVFFKKLKALTGLAPVEFIKEVRIKRAAALIEENEYTMTQISYMVGINDSRYFSKCFKQVYGMTPTEYKEQYLHQSGQNVHK
ncbi:MAG: response regulator [Tannerellaceae bacterium]|nr:response regulator [Tannerellaceae bacterium]